MNKTCKNISEIEYIFNYTSFEVVMKTFYFDEKEYYQDPIKSSLRHFHLHLNNVTF